VCLDSNVFLAVMVPEATKAPADDIRGAERLLRAIERGAITAVTSVMVLAEVRWVFAREQKPGFDVARATLESGFGDHLEILVVDGDIAVASAGYRRQYYSKASPFSDNDGIFLATGVRAAARALFTTDPHLLQITEITALRPREFPARLSVLQT